jgi:hypothetical protein
MKKANVNPISVSTTKQLWELIEKCLENPQLYYCQVGKRRYLSGETFYYEFRILFGPFKEFHLDWNKEYFRELNEEEIVSEIFGVLGRQGFPFYFDFKKSKFVKQMEVVG